MRFIKQSSLFWILVLSTSSIAFGEETYRGTIRHSPYGGSSEVYIRKDPDLGSVRSLRETLDTINAMEKLRNEREKMEMEREKLRLLKERNEIERKKLQQEQKNTDYSEKKSDLYKSYGNYYGQDRVIQSPHATGSQRVEKPFNVYLRNGKAVLCDYAWREGNCIFLVHHGKRFAVSYADSEIEMEKSFR